MVNTRHIAAFTLFFAAVAWGQSSAPAPSGNNGASANAPSAQGAQNPPPPPARPSGGDVNQAYQSAGGSLFAMSQQVQGGAPAGTPQTNSSASLYAVAPKEPRKLKKWDLITVIVREESDSKTKSLTDLKKTADIDLLLQQYIDFSLSNFSVKGRPPLTNAPEFKGSANRNFKGDGSSDRSDSFSARVQAQVIDVKPNGILIIQASKQIKNDDEEQRFTLTGMVRAEDVTPDNSVLSTQLADLSLEKMTKGSVSDTSKRGWLPKLFDAINPF